MHYKTRQYQIDCADAWYKSLKDPLCKPVVAVPTAAGKTVILGIFLNQYLNDHPDDRIVVLSHTQEIVEQDYNSLRVFFPEMEISIYSAGLGEKELGQITVAGIQSAINNVNLFKWTNLFIVDEVHAVNHAAVGSYRKLLDAAHGRVAGMSATIFRSGHGYIYEGKGTLFNHLAYDLTSVRNFNNLVEDGYLCELISVAPDTQLDSSDIKKSGGDYNVKHLAAAHDQESITKAAIQDLKKYGKNYRKWLVFAIDIDHADHICKFLNTAGIPSRVLHSRMLAGREDVLDTFQNGRTQAIVSVGMITTGFDAPCVDLIALLRPTMSAVLHVQMVGRGMRVFPGKGHCLVLDFAGNTERLGPINNVTIPKRKGKGKGEAPTKTCPMCKTITFARAKLCKVCGHEFVFETKLTLGSSKNNIFKKDRMTGKPPKWMDVNGTSYQIHKKMGKPDSVKVSYRCGISTVVEWLFPEHPGFPGRKSRHVLSRRGYTGKMNAINVVGSNRDITAPRQILVDFSGKYAQITNTR